MMYFARTFLGCVVIAVLSLSGCAANQDSMFSNSPGAAVVFGTNKPANPSSDGDPALGVVTGDRSWWWKGD
jgi:hypothetical protein